jgi:hypothetical protein
MLSIDINFIFDLLNLVFEIFPDTSFIIDFCTNIISYLDDNILLKDDGTIPEKLQEDAGNEVSKLDGAVDPLKPTDEGAEVIPEKLQEDAGNEVSKLDGAVDPLKPTDEGAEVIPEKLQEDAKGLISKLDYAVDLMKPVEEGAEIITPEEIQD